MPGLACSDRDRSSAPGKLAGQQEFSRTNDFRLLVRLARVPQGEGRERDQFSDPTRPPLPVRGGRSRSLSSKGLLGRSQRCPKAAPIFNAKGTAKPLCTNGLTAIVPLFGCRGRGRRDSVPGISAETILSFTVICGKSRRGKFLIKRKTRRDRMRAKLRGSRSSCDGACISRSPNNPPRRPACASHVLGHFPQLEFLHLPGRGLRQLREHHVARALVARQIAAAPGDELFGASPRCPGLSSTKAHGVSPHFSSGLATTAAACTAGCL